MAKNPSPKKDDDFDQQLQLIRESFIFESNEELSEIESMLLRMEKNPADTELLKSIYRFMHTIKGNAISLDFTRLGEVAHAAESLLKGLRDGVIPVEKRRISVLLEAVDVLRRCVVSAATGAAQPEAAALIRKLESSASQPLPKSGVVQTSPKAGAAQTPPKKGKPELVIPVDPAEAAPVAPGTSKPGAASEPKPGTEPYAEAPAPEAKERDTEAGETTFRTKSLRVGTDRVNMMMNLIGEIIIAHERLQQMLEARFGGEHADLVEAFSGAKRLSADLHEQISKIRMIPIGAMLRQQARTVRDLSERLGKPAVLEVEGEDVEVDTVMIDHLRDPVMHMVRNAMDHGIERPEVRQSLGKDPCGHIKLRAYHEANEIVLEVSDDGGGFDRDKILRKALAMGLVRNSNLSDAEVFALTFAHGFSTAETATDVSGRGVGMDVVLKNIEALHGSVSIKNRETAGSTITIRLPLTLAIIDGFLIEVAGTLFVVPLNVVSECMTLPKDARIHEDGFGVIQLRGEALSLLKLRHYFGKDAVPSSTQENVIVVSYQDNQFGLVADALYGKVQAVIKPMGQLFQDVPVSGSTILGQGQVALILDVASVLRKVVYRGPDVRGASTEALH